MCVQAYPSHRPPAVMYLQHQGLRAADSPPSPAQPVLWIYYDVNSTVPPTQAATGLLRRWQQQHRQRHGCQHRPRCRQPALPAALFTRNGVLQIRSNVQATAISKAGMPMRQASHARCLHAAAAGAAAATADAATAARSCKGGQACTLTEIPPKIACHATIKASCAALPDAP